MPLSYLARNITGRGVERGMDFKQLRTVLTDHFSRFLAARKAQIDETGPLSEADRMLMENTASVAEMELADGAISGDDSDIAQRVMLRFLDMGYCCLPVHDSFLVHHGLDAELRQIMVKEFGSVTGQSIPVKIKEGIDPTAGSGLVSSDIEAILNRDDEYEGYNSRWEDWLKLQ